MGPGVSLSGLKGYPEVPVPSFMPVAKHLEQTLPSVYTIQCLVNHRTGVGEKK